MDARRSLVSALSTLVVFCLCFVERGLSIKCYLCTPSPNVHGPKFCEDLPTLGEETRKKHLHDCNLFNSNYTMCTKIYQDIEGDIRVYYGCASLGSVGCIKRAGTYKIKSTYCHCDKDNCNSAPQLHKQYLIPLLLSTVVLVVTHLLAHRDV